MQGMRISMKGTPFRLSEASGARPPKARKQHRSPKARRAALCQPPYLFHSG